MKVRKLTPKQAQFVAEYLIDLNATQAAIRAGYSMKTADSIGLQLLRKTQVASAIEKAQKDRARRVEITQDSVLKEIARIAFVDPSEIFRIRSGRLVIADTEEMSEDVRRALASVTETTTKDGRNIRVQLASKLDALQLLGKHLGMFPVESRVKADVRAEIDGDVSVGVLVLPAADLGEE